MSFMPLSSGFIPSSGLFGHCGNVRDNVTSGFNNEDDEFIWVLCDKVGGG